MPVKVGGVILDIATNTAKVRKDFDQIQSNIKKFSYNAKRTLKTIGITLGAAFSVRAIKNFIVEGVRTIDTIQDMAQSAGMASREFQGLVQAASYAGVEATGVAKAVKRLNTNLLDANYGLAESKRLFDDIGITYKTTTGELRNTGEVIYEIADKFKNMGDNAHKAGLANKLLGRSGAELIPTLNKGSAELEKITDRLEQLGGVITDETLEAMDKVNQNFRDMEKAISAIKLQVLSGMADELQAMSDVAIKNADSLRIFEKIGDWFGTLAVNITASAVGFAGFMDLWGSFAGMVAAQLAEGPLEFFNVESNKLMMEQLGQIAEKWAQIIQDMRRPAKIELLPPPDKPGGTNINKLLEEQKSLIARLIKDSKTKVELLDEEYAKLRKILVQIWATKKLTGDVLKTYNAIGARMIKIMEELARIKTQDVWGNMKYGFLDYADTVADRSKQIQDAVIGGLGNMEDAMVDFAMTGKLEWASLRDAILADIARIVIRQRLMAPFARFIGELGGAPILEAPPANIPITKSAPATGPTAMGRARGKGSNPMSRYAGSSADLSVNLKNIVDENTYLMNRDVEDFVNNSERQFDELGRNLRKNLSIGRIGGIGAIGDTGGIGGGIGVPGGGTGGGAAPGGTISGITPGGGGMIDLGPIAGVGAAVRDPSLGNIANAIKETNMITLATKAGAKVVEEAVNVVKKPVKAIKKIFGWHTGGIVGDFPGLARIPRFHNGLRSDEQLGILQKGEEIIPKNEAGRGTTINVPITMADKNPAMAAELRDEIERTVVEVMRKYA